MNVGYVEGSEGLNKRIDELEGPTVGFMVNLGGSLVLGGVQNELGRATTGFMVNLGGLFGLGGGH